MKTKIIQYGLGPIGQQICRYIMNRTGLEILEAIDIDQSNCEELTYPPGVLTPVSQKILITEQIGSQCQSWLKNNAGYAYNTLQDICKLKYLIFILFSIVSLALGDYPI